MKVPFSNVTFDQEQIDAVTEVLKSGWPSRGKVTADFEEALSRYLNSNVVVVNSGSSALMASLLAVGVKAGDTVFVPDFTFIATASVPAILGCKVVPVDVSLDDFMIHPPILRRGNEALLYTDIAGLPSDWFGNNRLVEDAAQALGSEMTAYGKVGSWSHLTIFSFQATKQLSTVEGGAIASKNEELVNKCRKIADYGRMTTGIGTEYVHDELGLNMRTTDISSALGLIALKRLDKTIDRRKHIAERYSKEIPCVPQHVPDYVTRHAWWTFMCSGLNDRMPAFLDADIEAKRSFVPIHMQPCFKGMPTDYPNATWLYNNLFMLPCFQEMTEEQVDYVIEVANG